MRKQRMDDDEYVVVNGLVNRAPWVRDEDTLNLREDAWGLALDQRWFGPRRLVVAFAAADGTLLSIAHTERLDPPEDALDPCIRHLGLNADLAVAYCDEPVVDGPPPDDLAERFERARIIAASWGVHLVDWFACDDELVRSCRLALSPGEEWWNTPG